MSIKIHRSILPLGPSNIEFSTAVVAIVFTISFAPRGMVTCKLDSKNTHLLIEMQYGL